MRAWNQGYAALCTYLFSYVTGPLLCHFGQLKFCCLHLPYPPKMSSFPLCMSFTGARAKGEG